MTRADVFNKPLLNKFLRGLKMLPIYRIRDGIDGVRKNDATFESANTILQNGGVVGIFPEGSHSLKYKIRPLKKGVARIAFMAEENADFGLNLKVIPVGIQYESHFDQKGRTLITFGEPISVSDFKNTYLQDKNKGMEQLIAALSDRLKTLVLNIESNDYENVLDQYKSRRIYKTNLVEQLTADQNLIDSIERGTEFKDISRKPNFLFRTTRNLWDFLWKILAFIPGWLVERIVAKTTKDPHFYGTMRFGYSIFIYPIFFWLAYLFAKLILDLSN
jgi:hypothetical protein